MECGRPARTPNRYPCGWANAAVFRTLQRFSLFVHYLLKKTEVIMRRKLVGVIVWVACVTAMQAQQQRSPWPGATRGAIPDGAIADGREAGGRGQLADHAQYGGGLLPGQVPEALPG